MALTPKQELIRDLLVRERELRIERSKLVAQRDAAIKAAHEIFLQARSRAEGNFATAVATIDAELSRIADKLAGNAEIEEA